MNTYKLTAGLKHIASTNKGSVLIIVMWLIMLGLILVTAIAANMRLSATTVINHQEALHDWSQTLALLNKAHMELLIAKMPNINVQKTARYNNSNQENFFDGRPLKLSYPSSNEMTVRIMDLSGKLNISSISEIKLRQLLEHNLGEYDKRIPLLVDAWLDWLDSDNLKRLNGAEARYYKKQGLPYQPRNSNFASVAEIGLIRGFDEVFKDIELDKVFTLYGNPGGLVNPNIASKEVLMLLPGMTEQLAKALIAARKIQAFKNMGEVGVHLSPSVISKVSSWMDFRKSDYYAIMIHPSALSAGQEVDGQKANKQPDIQKKQSIYVYMEEVRVVNGRTRPIVLRVNPYAKISIE